MTARAVTSTTALYRCGCAIDRPPSGHKRSGGRIPHDHIGRSAIRPGLDGGGCCQRRSAGMTGFSTGLTDNCGLLRVGQCSMTATDLGGRRQSRRTESRRRQNVSALSVCFDILRRRSTWPYRLSSTASRPHYNYTRPAVHTGWCCRKYRPNPELLEQLPVSCHQRPRTTRSARGSTDFDAGCTGAARQAPPIGAVDSTRRTGSPSDRHATTPSSRSAGPAHLHP